MAINSENFCKSAYNALNIILSNAAAVAVLNGACWVFQAAGFGAITACGVYLTWICITNAEEFTSPDSDHYVHEPISVCAVAGTMLYCFAVDSKRKTTEPEFAPDALQDLI